jgi:hypothetical protein
MSAFTFIRRMLRRLQPPGNRMPDEDTYRQQHQQPGTGPSQTPTAMMNQKT